MSIGAVASGAKATAEVLTQDPTPAVDSTPTAEPAPVKKAGTKSSGRPKRQPASVRKRDSLRELPSFPEFVEGTRDPGGPVVLGDRLDQILRPVKRVGTDLVEAHKEGAKRFYSSFVKPDLLISPSLSSGLRSVYESDPAEIIDTLTEPVSAYDKEGRRKVDPNTGVFSAPGVTGREFEGLGPLTDQGQIDKINDALARASEDRQEAEDRLSNMERTGADADRIAQGRRDLVQAQQVYTQLVRIRDKTLPKRQQLLDLYEKMSQ